MSWTIAAVRSTHDTEFVRPPHRVLLRDHRLTELDNPLPRAQPERLRGHISDFDKLAG